MDKNNTIKVVETELENDLVGDIPCEVTLSVNEEPNNVKRMEVELNILTNEQEPLREMRESLNKKITAYKFEFVEADNNNDSMETFICSMKLDLARELIEDINDILVIKPD